MNTKSGRNYVYKEKSPRATINRISAILRELGISVNVTSPTNNLNLLYSCQLKLNNLPYGTCGKSYAMDFAKASAYGELLERLQNQLLYRHVDFRPATRDAFGFRKDPLERLVSGCAIPALPRDFRRAIIEDGGMTLYSLWIKHRKNLRARRLSATLVPYYSVRDKSVSYLPSEFISDFFGSNGMCAGNTPEEALDQGLSEICERYVQRELYSKELTPPDVPDAYLSRHAPVQFAMVEALRKSGVYKVVVKDCSMGRGLPVLGVLFLQPSSGHYLFSLGASPVWQVALERCLTEAFQGFSIGESWKLSPVNVVPPFEQKRDVLKNYVNYVKLVCTEVGHYPPALFDPEPDYEFNGFGKRSFRSQKEKLDYLIGLLRGTGCNIYIRDVSFLGWPAYSVISPGLSELLPYTPHGWKEIQTSYSRVEALSGIDNMGKAGLCELAEDMRGYILSTLPLYSGKDMATSPSLADYLRLPAAEGSPWRKVSLRMICAVLWGRLGEWEAAYQLSSEHVARMEKLYGTAPENRKYWVRSVAARDWFGLRARGVPPAKASARLQLVYGPGLVQRALVDLDRARKPSAALKALFKGLPMPRCWDCGNCEVRENCGYGELEKLHLRLKKAVAARVIDQMSVGRIISGD